MTLRIYEGMSSATDDFTISVTDSTATYTATVTKACHIDISSVVTGYGAFSAALKTALDAAAVVAGSARTYTVTYNSSTYAYTIAVSGGTFTINNSAAGTTQAMAHAIGIPLTSLPTAGAASTASTVRVGYLIVGTVGGRSDVSDDYEPDGIAYDGEADDGSAFGVARSGAPTYHDFTVRLEPKSATYSRSAVASVPWTHQHLFQNARNVEPVLVIDSNTSDSTVMKLKAEGASFRPAREVADYDDAWNVTYKCRVLGRL